MNTQNIDTSNPFFVFEVSSVCATCTKHLLNTKSYALDTLVDLTADVNLHHVLESQLQFKREGNGPSNLCSECFSKTLLFYEFQKQYKKSVLLFNKYVEYLEQFAAVDDAGVGACDTDVGVTKIKQEPEDIPNIVPEEVYITDEGMVKVEDESSNMDEDESTENDMSTMDCTQTDLVETNEEADQRTIPEKSKERYEIRYKMYCTWRSERGAPKTTEDVFFEYLLERSKIINPASLWSEHSMLKTMIKLRENVEVKRMPKVHRFMKQNHKNYTPKQSRTLTDQECMRFLKDAPDKTYLMKKVALIIGIYGACRSCEMTNIKVDNLQIYDDRLEVSVQQADDAIPRSFTIPNLVIDGIQMVDLVKKYISLRPAHTPHKRLFIFYTNGRCTTNPVGINTFAKMPASIAQYLNLPDAKLYTGHCFRRTSTTLLANVGVDFSNLKRRRRSKTPAVAVPVAVAVAEGLCTPGPELTE